LTIFRKIYYIWWAVAIVISSITILFQPVHLFDYLLKDFNTTSEMKISAAYFDVSTSKGRSVTVVGVASDKRVYFSLFDEEKVQLTDYLKPATLFVIF